MDHTFEIKFGRKFFKASRNSRALLVLFSGLSNDRKGKLQNLATSLHEALRDVDILLISSFPGGVWTFSSPEAQASDTILMLDQVCAETDYEDIRFLSYSMGAAMARKVLVGAFGEKAVGAPFEAAFKPPTERRNWHAKVSRLVSVSGYARGWFANPRMAQWTRIALNFFGFLGHFLSLTQAMRKTPSVPLIFALRRGAPFIFNTRIQWLGLSQSKDWRRQDMTIVHVMPSNDELVSTVEVIDLESDDQRKGVHYMTVPNSDHKSVLDVSAGRGAKTSLQRLDYMLIALCGRGAGGIADTAFFAAGIPKLTDARIAVPVDYLDDTIAGKPNENVSNLVFVVHGIRDTGAWAKKVGAELRRQFDGKLKAKGTLTELRTDTQSYGYFTAFPFIFPWIRRQKVEWLMDRYATARALYPRATISFVRHSNGTYLAAAALRDYENCTFDRIAFAGSVVRTDYDWEKLNAGRKRIGRAINYVATSDIVVAVGPKGINRLFGRFFDLGSAGHDGFDKEGVVKNIRYAVGSHGAGIAEHTWKATAKFILDGTEPQPWPLDEKCYASVQSHLARWLGYSSPIILAIAALVTAGLGWGLSEKLLGLPQWSPAQWLLNLPSSFWPASGLAVRLSAGAAELGAIWQCYGQLPRLTQSISMAVYWWFVWLALFRL
jgi:hypothetical protein